MTRKKSVKLLIRDSFSDNLIAHSSYAFDLQPGVLLEPAVVLFGRIGLALPPGPREDGQAAQAPQAIRAPPASQRPSLLPEEADAPVLLLEEPTLSPPPSATFVFKPFN